jgi:hypothetical protein
MCVKCLFFCRLKNKVHDGTVSAVHVFILELGVATDFKSHMGKRKTSHLAWADETGKEQTEDS